MTSKQRAYLRGLANTLEPIFQVGKSGISTNSILVQTVGSKITLYKPNKKKPRIILPI